MQKLVFMLLFVTAATVGVTALTNQEAAAKNMCTQEGGVIKCVGGSRAETGTGGSGGMFTDDEDSFTSQGGSGYGSGDGGVGSHSRCDFDTPEPCTNVGGGKGLN
jgi:hypothetical protein